MGCTFSSQERADCQPKRKSSWLGKPRTKGGPSLDDRTPSGYASDVHGGLGDAESLFEHFEHANMHQLDEVYDLSTATVLGSGGELRVRIAASTSPPVPYTGRPLPLTRTPCPCLRVPARSMRSGVHSQEACDG